MMHFRSLLLTIGALQFGLLMSSAYSQLQFEDVSASRGIFKNVVENGFGGGVAAFDFDSDGDIDMYLPQKFNNPDRLYRNEGNGNFVDIAAKTGINVNISGRSALWFDYNDDHLVDLLVTTDCFNSENPNCTEESTFRLYEQMPSGKFQDVSIATGIDKSDSQEFFGHRSSLCCGDIDRDGDLDLLIGQWEGELQLLINESGQFIDQSIERGITNPNAPFPHNPWQSVMHDFNGDGWLDIFTAVDFFENQFWLNQGDGTFVEIGQASGTDFAFNEMGVTIGDYDNDGDFDIYVTNIFEEEKHNLLLKNESTVSEVSFQEVSQAAGVDDTSFGWGATFFDADNDTFLDLAVTNGWFNGIGFDDTSKMFVNNGDTPPTFSDVSAATGFNDNFFGSCLISADLNRDGDLDLMHVCNPSTFEGPFRVLENQLQENQSADSNWLVVRPRQLDMNHWCIGAVVSVEIGEQRIYRAIGAGTSIHGQEPAEAFFGLGAATSVDRVIVKWPFGDETIWENVPAGQVFDAVDADLNLNGTIEMADLIILRSMLGPCEDSCQADLNHDGRVNRLDVIILRSMFRRKMASK